jgi:hypothetical protein
MDWDGVHEFDRILPSIPFKRYPQYVEPDVQGEYWKRVPYDDIKPLYISNYARVKNHKNRIIKSLFKTSVNRKYIRILYTSGKVTCMPLDRLMVITFIDQEEEGRIIHIDGDTSNSNLINLII